MTVTLCVLCTRSSQETVFQCLASWVRYVNIPAEELVRNPLLPAAFDALGKRDLFEPAVDLLVEVGGHVLVVISRCFV